MVVDQPCDRRVERLRHLVARVHMVQGRPVGINDSLVGILAADSHRHVLATVSWPVLRRHGHCIVIRPSDVRQDEGHLIPILKARVDLVENSRSTCGQHNDLTQWVRQQHGITQLIEITEQDNTRVRLVARHSVQAVK